MNTKTKRRMGVVTGIIVIVVIVVFAVVGGNSAAKTVSVAEAVELSDDNKIQVTGSVLENSYFIDGDVLTFKIYDAEADPDAKSPLDVRYDGGVAATFGKDVEAQCTGKKAADGVLNCSELLTKCPSKYESATDALTVGGLLGYGDAVVGKPVKVAGTMKAGSLGNVSANTRFVIVDDEGNELPVKYDGALSDETGEGAHLVLGGSFDADGAFTATSVSLEG